MTSQIKSEAKPSLKQNLRAVACLNDVYQRVYAQLRH